MTPIKQLWEIYNKYENWHINRLNEKDFTESTTRLINSGNLFYVTEKDVITGYVECFRVNYEQLGRLVCKESFYVYDENITDGKVAYINNMWSWNVETTDYLTMIFIEKFGNCHYLALHRKHGLPFRVYPMSRIVKINKIGV